LYSIHEQVPFIFFGVVLILMSLFLSQIISSKVNQKIADSVMLEKSRKSFAADLDNQGDPENAPEVVPDA
jgi:hypothetical protein